MSCPSCRQRLWGAKCQACHTRICDLCVHHYTMPHISGDRSMMVCYACYLRRPHKLTKRGGCLGGLWW